MELNSTIRDVLRDKTLGFQLEVLENYGEITLVCPADKILELCSLLKNGEHFQFDTLIDLCGVDYLKYGESDWEIDFASGTGFCRGVEKIESITSANPARFAVVYHFLSTKLNHRVRVKVFLAEEVLSISSVTVLWNAANWFEREAYDLYGILFEGHQDLRRLLTDYGFVGHPFRKDFPVSGHIEMRYDATLQRVVYEPVEIEPRILVPKVIRNDNRYIDDKEGH
jgi:NADH-quinone oxidoreductase subunit C